MRILVFSDTHGIIDEAEYAIRTCDDPGLIIHLGDYCKDAERLAKKFPGTKFEYVSGNCDFYTGTGVSSEKLLNIKGYRFFLTHGHLYFIKQTYRKIIKKAESMKSDVVLFGHTHKPCIERFNGILFLNPGSTSCPRGSAFGSYLVIDINSDGINPQLFYT